MDYDDNDFQSQNFQLGADDNKFPLPKFDIDEHLQVNLRFDSLVDTDILLGIQNQDNNWIEDFSSGTSAIEFNSSAAKTHTISRHTNVWSEATSSESVEMLLKSVGQDEMNNNKTIAMESDLQNTSNNLINPVEPTRENDNDNSVMATFAQDDPSLQPNKVERIVLDQNTDASEEVRQCPESVSDALKCCNDLSNDDAQKASSPSVEPTVESDLQYTSNDLIRPVGPTQESEYDNSMIATFAQGDPSLQPDKVERSLSDKNTDASEEVGQCSESVSDVRMCYSDLHNDDAQKVSSPFVEPIMDSLVLINDGGDVSEISENCDVLLEAAAYQVEVTNIESKAVEIAGEKNTEMMNQNDKELGNIEAAREANYIVDTNPKTLIKYTVDENSTDCDHPMIDMQTHESEIVVVEKSIEVKIVENDEEFGSKLISQENAVQCISSERVHSTAEYVAASVGTEIINQNEKELGNIEAAREVNSPTDTNPKTPMNYTVVENSTDRDPPEIYMQTDETELVVVEKSVEANIVENDEESWSKLNSPEDAVESISSERVHSTTEDVAASVSTDAANLKSNISLVDTAEVTTFESEDTHLIDAGSGFGVPSVEESIDKIESHLDDPLSENRSSEPKDTSPKSQTYDFVNADVKEIKTTEDAPNNYVQVPSFKDTVTANFLVLASEVSNQLSAECMKSNEAETSIFANSNFAQLEGNVDNRQLKGPNFCENKLPVVSMMGVQNSCHVESSDGSQCKFQLQSMPDTQVVEENIVSEKVKYILSLPDKSDVSPEVNMQTVSGEFPCHHEEEIMSTPSPSAVKPPITQGDSPVIEENVVSEKEKYNYDKTDASLDANVQTVSNISGYGESTSHSEETILSTFSPSTVKPPIAQGDSPVVEHIVSEKEKSDKVDASSDASMPTVTSISAYGKLPCHSEENILSTPSPSAVKPPITQGNSPVVEYSVSGKKKSDESDAYPDANMQTASSFSGYVELPSPNEEYILSTPSSTAVKPPTTLRDSVVDEHIVTEKEKYKPDESVASPDANMQTVSIISGYGGLPTHNEESILSTPSPSAVKTPITQGDSPVVEEHIVSKKKNYVADKSDASLDANMQLVSHISGYGGLPSHNEKDILSTPSPSAVKLPITYEDSSVVEEHIISRKEKCELPSHSEENILPITSSTAVKPPITLGDSPLVVEHIVSEKEKYKSDKSGASPDANMQTVSNISGYGGLASHSQENILSTHSSALKPSITQGDSPVVEEHIVSEKKKDKYDNSGTSSKVNMQIGIYTSGEFSSHSREIILTTPSPSDVKPSDTHVLAVKEGKKSAEQSYSSSTIVNTSVPSHDNSEGYKIDVIKHIIPDSRKSIAIDDDKSFSFETREGPNMADNSAGKQWKPFPDVLSSDSPKTPKEIAKSSSEKKSPKPRAKSVKGTATRKKSSEGGGIPCTTSSVSVGTVSSGIQLDEVKLKTESSRRKKMDSPIIQPSNLPDLNSSVSASTLIHQPFSDIQQVQLRAQIFVYGSLIQGIPPDEACMQSAFGEKDGGKSIWETVWRKSVDRYQTQKSPANQETPLLSHSAVRVSNQETKSGSSQSKVSGTSASIFVGKSIAPAIAGTPLSGQSPVWNMTSNFPRAIQLDFNQASTPLQPYPSSQTRQFTNNSTPWLPSNPRPAQWAISSQSPALKSATQYSSVLAVDTVKVTPIRESSMPHASLVPSPIPVSIPFESQGKTASPQKSRKRKKALVTEDISKTIVVSQSTPTSIVPKSLPTLLPIAPLTTNTPLKVMPEPIVETVPHISPPAANSCQMINTVNDDQTAKFSEETCNKIEQAKLHAEEAASIAASVVSHGQGIWNQIAAHKNSSVPIDLETKLASVAAAAAAAASVAKAAAAAAKVAFEAAVQAKVMADEAVNSAKTGIHTQSTGATFDAGKNLAMLTPGSILKGKDKMHGSSTIISAACDAARKRVEEASAASKRAENLNAIMKAAELAAEAVSHVGTIIAMGDPLPFKLSELVEAGPEGSWKSFKKANQLKDLDQSEKTSFSNQKTDQTVLKDGEQPVEVVDNCDGSGKTVGKSSTLSNDGREKDPRSLEENTFRKGSLVEVISDEDGLKGGWFSARVLDVEDNKVHVCYNNLLSDDGSEQLKEWVALDSEINGSPRIRIAHPRIVTKNEGTKKRRREAVNNYVWEVGDHVDAWMRDGWWEGIIIEKSKLDETKLTVQFPAGGDSSLVRAWDLRTSLSWKDGQWTEWSRAEERKSHEGDTPHEKRRKLAQLETKTDAKVDSRGKDALSKEPSLDIPETAEASKSLNLSKKDAIFSLGKKEDNISDAPKGKRTGPHKEGTGVVFGVPKGPGKKQKFMDVSKHYSTDKSDKSNHGKDSHKFPKYMMPQASQSWRNTSKMDPRGKRVVDTKSVGVKSARTLNSNVRNVKQKGSNTSATSASNDENPEKNYAEDSVSSRLGSTEKLVAASKKKPSSVNEGDRGVKRRFTPSKNSFRSEKKSEVSESETSDANEPRRSTRKIQPTSRLLEGLQSSMMMSRIPSFTHGKSSKTPHRSSSSRGNTRG